MNTGIYLIEHKDSGRVYVGSAVNFTNRWKAHRCHLKKGTHHAPHLQSAWNKYGEAAFEFKKLLVCKKTDLLLYEQRAIDTYHAADRKHGFNTRQRAESTLGYKHSPESCAKYRACRKGRKATDKTRALLSAIRLGKKMPEGTGAKISAAKLGHAVLPETRAKISAAQAGRKDSIARIESRCKLTLAIARSIRDEYSHGGVSQSQLSEKYKVDQSAISLIVRGKRWNY